MFKTITKTECRNRYGSDNKKQVYENFKAKADKARKLRHITYNDGLTVLNACKITELSNQLASLKEG